MSNSAVIVTIFDVDNQPVIGCDVECIEGSTSRPVANSGANQFACIPQDPTFGETWTITVRHNDFFAEKTNIHVQDMKWTNPTCSLTRGTEAGTDTVQVRFVLSRIRLAPSQYLPGGTIAEMRDVPAGVLLADERTAPPAQLPFHYRGLFTDELNVYRLEHPILPEHPEDDWGKFRHTVRTKVNPHHYGSFRWLEYGTGMKRYAVAVWLPWAYLLGTKRHELDFVVFCSPTTALGSYVLDHGQTYPYGLRRHGATRIQPYMALGQLYVLNNAYICYQLLAALKTAIIVMPINNFGDWGPFSSGPGLYRLLEEIAHYVAKQRKKMMAHVPIHGIRMAATAAYSSGLAVLDSLLNDATKKGPLSNLFYATNVTAFRNCWMELWDIDLDLKGVLGSYEEKFMKWLGERPDRQFRMYHSQHTAGNWKPSKGPVLSKIQGNLFVSRMANGDSNAEELHARNGQWSAVYFSNSYLERTKSLPAFNIPNLLKNDPHHFVPRVALGHAALLSRLKALSRR